MPPARWIPIAAISGSLLWSSAALAAPVDPVAAGPPVAADAPSGEETGRIEDRSLQIESLEIVGREQVSRRQVVGILDGEGLVQGATVLWPVDDRVEKARARLQSTGYFRRVTIRLKPIEGTIERVNLVVELEERGSLTVDKLYLGTTRLTPFRGGIEVTERNLLGRSVHVGGGLIWSTLPRGVPAARRQQGYALHTEVPGIAKSRVGLGARAYFLSASEPFRVAGSRTNPDPSNFDTIEYARIGGAAGITLPFTSRLRLGIDYRFEGLTSQAPIAPVWATPEGELREIDLYVRRGNHRLAAAEFSLRWDGRDPGTRFGRGGRIRLDVNLSSPAVGSSYEYVKVVLGGGYSFALPWGHWITPSALGGQVAGNAPRFELFYPGDFHDWTPGREFGMVYGTRNPVDVFGTGVNGHGLAHLGGRFDLEYTIPVFRRSRTAFFAGGYVVLSAGVFVVAGDDETRRQRKSDGLKVAPPGFNANFGLRLDTSIGVIDLSVGNVLRRTPL